MKTYLWFACDTHGRLISTCSSHVFLLKVHLVDLSLKLKQLHLSVFNLWFELANSLKEIKAVLFLLDELLSKLFSSLAWPCIHSLLKLLKFGSLHFCCRNLRFLVFIICWINVLDLNTIKIDIHYGPWYSFASSVASLGAMLSRILHLAQLVNGLIPPVKYLPNSLNEFSNGLAFDTKLFFQFRENSVEDNALPTQLVDLVAELLICRKSFRILLIGTLQPTFNLLDRFIDRL